MRRPSGRRGRENDPGGPVMESDEPPCVVIGPAWLHETAHPLERSEKVFGKLFISLK